MQSALVKLPVQNSISLPGILYALDFNFYCSSDIKSKHVAGQRCFELLALISSLSRFLCFLPSLENYISQTQQLQSKEDNFIMSC